MSMEETTNEDLLRQYKELVDERLTINRRIKVVKEELTDRIVSSEDHAIETATQRASIMHITGDRVKSIKEIEEEYGEEWVDENRRRLTKTIESKKLKIEPKD